MLESDCVIEMAVGFIQFMMWPNMECSCKPAYF